MEIFVRLRRLVECSQCHSGPLGCRLLCLLFNYQVLEVGTIVLFVSGSSASLAVICFMLGYTPVIVLTMNLIHLKPQVG